MLQIFRHSVPMSANVPAHCFPNLQKNQSSEREQISFHPAGKLEEEIRVSSLKEAAIIFKFVRHFCALNAHTLDVVKR